MLRLGIFDCGRLFCFPGDLCVPECVLLLACRSRRRPALFGMPDSVRLFDFLALASTLGHSLFWPVRCLLLLVVFLLKVLFGPFADRRVSWCVFFSCFDSLKVVLSCLGSSSLVACVHPLNDRLVSACSPVIAWLALQRLRCHNEIDYHCMS